MLQSFSDKDTQELFEQEHNRRFAAISRVALRKLIQVNQARRLSDLSKPPGNRLEALSGRLAGFHSIRVNERWRIVFQWTLPVDSSSGPIPDPTTWPSSTTTSGGLI